MDLILRDQANKAKLRTIKFERDSTESVVLGRADIPDAEKTPTAKKVSRRQLEIKVDPVQSKVGSLVLDCKLVRKPAHSVELLSAPRALGGRIFLGTNPCFIIRGRDGSIETLDKSKAHCFLYAGDKIHLAGNLFPISVSASSNAISSTPAPALTKTKSSVSQSTTPTSSSTAPAKPPVPKRIMLFDDDIDDISPEKPPKPSSDANSKKRKLPEMTHASEVEPEPEPAAKKPKPNTESKPPKSAFAIMMESSKSQSHLKEAPSKPPASTSSSSSSSSAFASSGAGGWAGALAPYVLTPEKFPDAVYHYDSKIVVIYDKYPKAKYHFLVMPRELIDGFRALSSASVPMIKELKKIGDKIVKNILTRDPNVKFRLGFHAIPSMRQIHMHVISEDFDSENLKNKKHWNSFTTSFFINADDFIAKLATTGAINFDKNKYEEMLKGPLCCNRCGEEISNIPKLKVHIKTCKK